MFRTSLSFVFLGLCLVAVSQGSDEIPNPFFHTSNAPHQVRVLNEAAGALELRLQMIASARESIDLEYFAIHPDQVGRAVLQALVKKAREGVKVRVLVDYYEDVGSPGINAYLAQELKKNGIELKYFNIAKLWQLWKVGFRDHRKIFIIDGREMIMGGRNLAEPYFGLSKQYNYMDRDIWVQGPVVRAALETVKQFWVHENAKTAKEPKGNSAKSLAAAEILIESESDRILRAKIAQIGSEQLLRAPVTEADAVTFFSDGPVLKKRVATQYVHQLLSEASESVKIENYIYLPGKEKQELLRSLEQRGVDVQLLTNSHESSDSSLMPYLTHGRHTKAVRDGVEVSGLTGEAPQGEALLDEASSDAKWGTHAKSAVIDDKDTLISSYNMDPRSDNLDAEAGIVIHDSSMVAGAASQSIDQRVRQQGEALGVNGKYSEGQMENSKPKISSSKKIFLWPLKPLMRSQY